MESPPSGDGPTSPDALVSGCSLPVDLGKGHKAETKEDSLASFTEQLLHQSVPGSEPVESPENGKSPIWSKCVHYLIVVLNTCFTQAVYEPLHFRLALGPLE